MTQTEAKKLQEAGVALFRQGEYTAAQEKLNQALAQAEDGSVQQAQIYNDLGVVCRDLEDFDAAHDALDEATDIFETLDNRKGLAQTLGNRAALLEAEEELEEAVEVYKESAKMLEEVGESEMAMYVWQAISRLRTKQKQYIAAIGAYEEGIEKMPDKSFKKKVLKQILKAPNSLLGSVIGGGGATADADEPDSKDKSSDSGDSPGAKKQS